METIGKAVAADHCTTLRPGLNAVSIPNEDACYSAYTLMEDISGCSEVHRWDQFLQKWVSLVKISTDTLMGVISPSTPETVIL